MNRKLLALYGLKWSPFSPEVPAEALYVSRQVESFCWRVENLVSDGGFALVTGQPGLGKSVALRILAERLGAQQNVQVGILSRPQAGLSDFFRELGDMFGAPLRPHNRHAGAKVLRQRWQAHIDSSFARPVILVDEGQEMSPAVLGELRLLSAVKLDSLVLLTVVLAGDQRLAERFRSEELLPLGSRIRARLVLERASTEDLQACLRHVLDKAGAPQLMTPDVIVTLSEHAGQLPGSHEHGRRAAGHRRPATDPADRRKAVPGGLHAAGFAPEQNRRETATMNILACKPACDLPVTEEEHRWLVRDIWAEEAVGVIGAEPKSYKTFLALELAVAVASGAPCLRYFPVARSGRVLLYAAEDPLTMVRRRLEGICAAAGLKIEGLDIQVITEHTLRLDLEPMRRSLDATVAKLRPRFLILDPFVRLHRIDENVSGEVAPLLAFLRELQRRHAVAVLVVHHAKKGAGRVRAGQALRGSSEFHAWGDCNLYLKKQGDDTVSLTVEHRAAPSIRPLTLELATNRLGVALRVVDRAAASVEPPSSVDERIIAALTASQRPLSFPELRGLCRTRSTTVYERLAALTAIGRVSKSPQGYRLAAAANGRSPDKS